MGIVNVTPDSFSDGGRFLDPTAAVAQAIQLFAAGADIVDVGGESTRPGAARVGAEEELRRVLPVITGIRAALPDAPISLDTTRAEVARAGIAAGASLVNDVSGGTLDAEMLPTVARLGVPVCLMHLPVLPEAMGWSRAGGGLAADADAPAQVIAFLRQQIDAARTAGISDDRLLIDPGFGFGKTPEQNLDLLRRTGEIKAALDDLPLLFGPSRKSTIARILGDDRDRADPERVAGTAALVALSAAYGVDIARVHDASFMARVARVADAVARPVA
jgi:dihydropteroate synthase